MFYSAIIFSTIANLILNEYNTSIDINKLNSKDKIIILCLNNNFIYLLNEFLDLVYKPFIIITAMEDNEFPRHFNIDFINKVISNKYFKHWFPINKTIENNKCFTGIPYGLDYWTLTRKNYFGELIQTIEEQNNCFEKLNSNLIHFSKRILKIYDNSHLHQTDKRYNNWRSQLQNIIDPNIIDFQPNILPRTQALKNMSKYAFIISPYGNGLDCIRTFEALCMGCIVILQNKYFEEIYKDLPVIYINEWYEVNNDLLKNTLNEFSNKKFNYDKLKIDYWIKIVNSVFHNIN